VVQYNLHNIINYLIDTVDLNLILLGTPEYLAPEILENKGHGKAVDWWALGTLLYEMLCGLPPFYDTNVQKMYQKILTAPLRFPRPDPAYVNYNI
jgi:serine/threonine protein kinase